jgi:uncharacterized protein YcnI
VRLTRHCTVVVLTVATTVVLAAPAWAHGQLRPGRAAAGATIDTVLVVPSERDGHGNSRIALALPPGFTPKSCRSPIGWRCTTQDKGFTWERVTGLVEAEDFDVTMQVATSPGTYVLPLAQTYDDGETRTFTGEPGARDEAPVFTVTGAAGQPSPTPQTPRASSPAAVATQLSPTVTPSKTTPASASPVPATSSSAGSVDASSSASPASGAGLDALPSGRRLETPSSEDAPVVLVAVGFVALTVLGSAVLLIRRRQAGPTDAT